MDIHPSRCPQPTLSELSEFLKEQGRSLDDYNALPPWERAEILQQWHQVYAPHSEKSKNF
ncbi:MAG TPA: hypothetical protein V6C57_19830 [Coleofasciculaceae cyanobacterium]